MFFTLTAILCVFICGGIILYKYFDLRGKSQEHQQALQTARAVLQRARYRVGRRQNQRLRMQSRTQNNDIVLVPMQSERDPTTVEAFHVNDDDNFSDALDISL